MLDLQGQIVGAPVVDLLGGAVRDAVPYSAYLFFNAAVQGTARVLEALKSPRVQGLMAGVTGLAATLAVMGASMGGDDDDGDGFSAGNAVLQRANIGRALHAHKVHSD